MRRVMVIGGPGSGKSTLAREIGARLSLPVIHIDALFWQPGWVEGEKAILHERLRRIYAREAWVIDGEYMGSARDRLERADTVIFLDLPGWLRLARVARRALRYRGAVRPDMAEGCPEQFDPAFAAYLLRYARQGRRRALHLLANAPEGVRRHHLRSPAEVRRFLERL